MGRSSDVLKHLERNRKPNFGSRRSLSSRHRCVFVNVTASYENFEDLFRVLPRMLTNTLLFLFVKILEKRKNLHRIGVSSAEHVIERMLGIPYGPVAFVMSRCLNMLRLVFWWKIMGRIFCGYECYRGWNFSWLVQAGVGCKPFH